MDSRRGSGPVLTFWRPVDQPSCGPPARKLFVVVTEDDDVPFVA